MTQTSFDSAIAAAVTGVSVVTTDGAMGRHGLTVTSMAVVTATPPTLLFSIDRRSPLLRAIEAHRAFAVNALGVRQAAVAEAFAGRGRDFDVARWERGGTGVPLLVGAAARFECLVASTHDAGSHTIVIGDVMASDRNAVRALAYSRRAYVRPVPLGARAKDREDLPMRRRRAVRSFAVSQPRKETR